MQFRHEVKQEISRLDMIVLRQRLGAVLQRDAHVIDGRYQIRSLYFDTPSDKALREKLDGVNIREKYRIRMYNHDPSVIQLERKYKHGGLGYKETTGLTPWQVEAILAGDVGWMVTDPDSLYPVAHDPVLLGFYTRIRNEGLGAKVLVDYTREPFVYGPGNVRVTLDYDIRTGLSSTAFFDAQTATIPVAEDPCILEVKWDAYLPDMIRDAVQLPGRRSGAYSIYAACRMYD